MLIYCIDNTIHTYYSLNLSLSYMSQYMSYNTIHIT